MSINTVKDELSSRSGYDHVTFSVDGGDNYVVLLENGAVTGAYAVNDKFNLQQRAGFSLDQHVSGASIDANALKIELAAHPDVVANWHDSYTVNTIANLTEIDESAIHVTETNEPLRDDEVEIKIEPVDLDTLFQYAYDELQNRADARKSLGFTDEELEDIGFQAATPDGFKPQTDAENFVALACGQGLSINDTLSFSNGFYLSEILKAVVDLAEDEKITLSKLDAGNNYTETVTIGSMRPEQTDPSTNSLAYLDAERNDGRDADSAADLYRDGEGITEADLEKPDDVQVEQPAALLNVPELPSFDLSTVSAHTDEAQDGGAQEVEVDQETADLFDQALPEDPEVTAAEDEAYAEPTEETDETAEAGDESLDSVDALVNAVSKAREALQSLKDQKAEVDSRLAGLPIEEAEEVSKQIASLKEDRAEIDEKIEALRQQKAQVDSDIADARARKAEIEEELSHKDELEAESSDLKNKIASLNAVL